MQARIDITGKRFDKRVVLSLAEGRKNGRSRWNVRCDCGREFTCLRQDLRRGGPCRQCSPGLKAPRPHKRVRPFEAQYNAWSKKAHHKVEITYEQFVELTKITECHYCGYTVKWMEHGLKGIKRTNASNLDRKDNTDTYSIANVVICCRRCNKAKNDFFSYEEWKQLGNVIRTWEARNEESKVQQDAERPTGSLVHHYPGGCQVIGPSTPFQRFR